MRAEVEAWGLGSADVDPGEVLLRLVAQSSARVELYGRLLGEAYEAAERLREAHDAEELVLGEYGEHPEAQSAREDLRRIFSTGGVAALVGRQYTSTKDGDVFATGEAVRGLAQLESAERDRCASFCAKAVAAGLAERQVRLAERQGAMIADVLRAVLGDDRLGLSEGQLEVAPDVIAAHLSIAG